MWEAVRRHFCLQCFCRSWTRIVFTSLFFFTDALSSDKESSFWSFSFSLAQNRKLGNFHAIHGASRNQILEVLRFLVENGHFSVVGQQVPSRWASLVKNTPQMTKVHVSSVNGPRDGKMQKSSQGHAVQILHFALNCNSLEKAVENVTQDTAKCNAYQAFWC